MKRKIAVVTTSRADYSHLYWPLRELSAHPDVELKIIAMAAHLSPEFGATIHEIERDGFGIAERIECLLSSDTDVGMAKTIGLATLSLADVLGRMRPDLLLLIADRYEMLAPASVALALRIPIAHIEGGEVSEGAIDDAVRNALTMMSHIHFTSTQSARERVIAMGEESWRVYRAGAPSLDQLRRRTLLTREQLENRIGIALKHPAVLVAYHPVTLARDTVREADSLFAALQTLPDQILFCYPNADAGSRNLIERARAFAEKMSAELAISVTAAETVEQTVVAADIICTVTSAFDPILKGSWVRPGTHLNLVGSSFAGPAEVDSDLVVCSRFIADSREGVLNQGGEFLRAKTAGLVGDDHVVAEIGQVLAGKIEGRRSAEEVTVYKSLGHVVQDLSSAWALYSQA